MRRSRSTLREYGETYNVNQARSSSMEPDGARPRHGRRARLRRIHVQPRRQRAPPARLVVQALRLRRGAGDRKLHARQRWWSTRRCRSATGRRRTTGAPTRAASRCASALTQSINTVAVRLSIETGRQPIADLAARMGVPTPTQGHALAAARQLGGDRARPGDRLFGLRQRRLPGRAARADRRAHAATATRRLRRRRRRRGRGSACCSEATVLGMIDMLHSVVETAPAGAPGFPASTSPARPARPMPIATPGSSASPAITRRRLARQRRLPVDQQADRRHPAGRDLAEVHARRHGLRGAEAAARPAAARPTRASKLVAERATAARSSIRAPRGASPPATVGRARPHRGALQDAASERRRCGRRRCARLPGRPRPRSDPCARIVRFLVRRGSASSLALGLWSAWLAVRSPAPIDAIALGAWQAWPNAGTTDADPYSRARAGAHRRDSARLRRRADAARAAPTIPAIR